MVAPRLRLNNVALPSARKGHIRRLEKATGQARAVVPRDEAKEKGYYDLPGDFLGQELQPERIFEKIESGASIAIRNLEREQAPPEEAMAMLAYFAALPVGTHALGAPRDQAP
jgi:hypothetical protein